MSRAPCSTSLQSAIVDTRLGLTGAAQIRAERSREAERGGTRQCQVGRYDPSSTQTERADRCVMAPSHISSCYGPAYGGVVSLTHSAGEVTSKYYVVDGVEALQKFGQDAWDRVICVVTTGQAWQFKPYKWQDPRVLFRNGESARFRGTVHPAWMCCSS